MSDQQAGYQIYWKRIARHVRISTLAKEIGVKATELSAFEQGQESPVTPEQVERLHAILDAIPIEEPDVPENEETEEDEA